MLTEAHEWELEERRQEIRLHLFFIILTVVLLTITGLNAYQTNKGMQRIEQQAQIIESAYAAPEKSYAPELKFERKQKSKSLGTFTVTAYCACSKCCGKSDGITATGTKAKQGRTIAVDPRKIPYGTRLKIGGHTYVAEDCGGAIKGNRLDIFFNNHNDALKFGVQKMKVEKL